jgi:hypothetical protein
VILAASAVAVLALVVVGAAFGDKEQVRLTKADMAKARAIALRISDIGGAGRGWTGAAKKPDPPSSLDCGTYSPKQSDLVLTGQAETDYAVSGLEFDNQVEILKTARMVKLDWQRSVGSPELLPCLRRLFAKNLPASEKLISFSRIGFPKIGTYSAAYRAIIDVGATSKTRVMIDFALVGIDRTEITLITTAPYAVAKQVSLAEVQLARALIARATPGAA